MSARRLHPTLTRVYATLLPDLVVVARIHGYALAVHGSLATDLDLIAIPWVDAPSDPNVLVEALRKEVGGEFRPMPPCRACAETKTECFHVDSTWPVQRPHGRLSWAIYLSDKQGGPYLDVSVMPRSTT